MPIPIIQHPIPMELKKIYKKKMDGELIIKGRNISKNLYFYQGKLIFAKTNVLEERLGELLFQRGTIDRSQYSKINDLIKNSKNRLGEILVRNNIITQDELFETLLVQIHTVALSTFSLISGEWDFLSYIPQVPDDFEFNIELPKIISEGIDKISILSYFKNMFGTQNINILPIPKNSRKFVSESYLEFYKELLTYTNLPVDQVKLKFNISEEKFWRIIVLLYLLDMIAIGGIDDEDDLNENVEEVIRLYEHLKLNKIDYYSLLGIKNTASFIDIKNAYFSNAKKFHPDRISKAPDPDIKERANFVFAEINTAYETLIDQEKRLEYDFKGYKESSLEVKIRRNLTEKATILYRKAKTLYNQKKFWEASSLMEEAIKLDDNKASYFLLLGLSQMNIDSLKRRAEKNFQKAIEMEHWNVDAYVGMGMLFFSENHMHRAEGFFRKALSVNPDNRLARNKLDEIVNSESKNKKSKFSFFKKKRK